MKALHTLPSYECPRKNMPSLPRFSATSLILAAIPEPQIIVS
jgi:hypothetical protein